MTERCDVCGASDSMRPHLELSLCGILDARVHRCTECGFRQVRPRLTSDDLRRLYPDEYFDPDAEVGFADYAKQRQRGDREAFFLAPTLLKIKARGHVLDVGCALGFHLEALRRRTGWEAVGIDVSPFAAFFAGRRFGLDVRACTLDEAAFPDASFDFVIQKDLLEHVLRPREHLEECRRVLRPQGMTLLITPNGEANLRPLERLAERLREDRTDLLPRLDQGHLSFFTRDNLQRLFRETGFEIVEFSQIALRRGLRSLGLVPWRRAKTVAAARTGLAPGSTTLPPPARPRSEREMTTLYDRLDAEMRRHHAEYKTRPWYFRFRHAMRTLDSWNGPGSLGQDFRCLLRRCR